jgi:hypothetical protein
MNVKKPNIVITFLVFLVHTVYLLCKNGGFLYQSIKIKKRNYCLIKIIMYSMLR